ncbi:crotonase/enoyl-CoA hydratase family protein [Nocardia vaccinii]|uniref:crotonase/enoyl-CoA hydratase family protein n=1 Tax=Nocardia vaccinii TaxID=1822 RepID=UPI000833391D|nr:crotonase/enoyl-CoA hydratase family protein [Nocardia vaccinii]
MAEPLMTTRDGHVESWTLNIPQERNPISGADMIDALVAAAMRVSADPAVRAVVLTGMGPAFSAGGDLRAMAGKTGMFASDDLAVGYRDGIQRIARALFSCTTPLIAAVNGPAVGAGFDLALMCDLRIASSTAFFAESFVKVGLVPGDGGAFFLPRVVGAARAVELALTGDRISAETALEWGVVSRVVPPEELLGTARDLAHRIAANPPIAVRRTKELFRDSSMASLDVVLDRSAAFQAELHETVDHAEAVSAFLEKRTPEFTGK